MKNNVARFLWLTVYIWNNYVTVNVSKQGMCIFPEIFREYTHSLIHSGIVYIPWYFQGIYTFSEK